ncbi:DUF7345 domain-containing protein [Natronorubrum sp. FCH18a]|uniref:DUF7345 domain-containing protein n=1 Tax=Natronorubrum sp. FCH18a TaxID=3447018 RepID=UPI003F519219
MQRELATVGVISLLLVSAFALPVAASSPNSGESVEESAVHVDLDADGDATVSLVSIYDLTDPNERDAFETLREDESAQEELLDRAADRFDSVATNAEANVEREMTVSAESADVSVSDDRGIVTLSVNWEGLAAVEDDTLVVTEPFASGFDADRSLVVTAPTEATIGSSTPEPTTQDETRATWDAETDLDGFELTVSGATTASDDASDGTPGFTGGVALVAVGITVASLAANRR